ncbi:DEAD/DEAH box helicase [Candidatus Undinarchaeota archaeon]
MEKSNHSERYVPRPVGSKAKSKSKHKSKSEHKPKFKYQPKPAPDPHKRKSVEEFKKLGLIEPILDAIAEQDFDIPTEIQILSVPPVVAGKDVIARAATGSGKTLAFAAGIIQNSKKGQGIQALLLTPTRELAVQVARAIKGFSKYKSLKIVTVYGGVPINRQIHALETADVVVATPGRLLDHLERGTIRLNEVKTLVLDEADTMLDMGFINDVRKIISACPKERQTLLFSATVSSAVSRLAKEYLNSPQEIFAESYVDPTKLEQVYYDVPTKQKFSLLVHMLKHEDAKLVMVFCNTRRFVDYVSKNLKQQGIDALAIHGGFQQSKRSKALDSFHSHTIRVLVCTDVAARGLDIPHVSHIYNYDIPKESKQYVHRIGRTARAGKEGKVINILSTRDHENFRRVCSENDLQITRMEPPQTERIDARPPERGDRRQGGNRRGGAGSNRGRSGGRTDGNRSRSPGGRSRGRTDGNRSRNSEGGDRGRGRERTDRNNNERSSESSRRSSSRRNYPSSKRKKAPQRQ